MRNQFPITPKTIYAFRAHKLPEFESIYQFMRSNNFKIDLNYSYVARRMPQLDKIYWKSKRPLIPLSSHRTSSKLKGNDLIHHGIHFALTKNITSSLRGFPHFVLFCECIASCSDLYFLAAYYNRYGLEHPCVTEILNLIKKNCLSLKQPYVRMINASLQNPWHSFQKSVEDMYAVLSFLLKISKNSRRKPYRFRQDLEEILFKSPFYGFITTYDLHVFVAYAHFHCGSVSKPSDRRLVRLCRQKIRTSGSMSEFLEKIGITPVE